MKNQPKDKCLIDCKKIEEIGWCLKTPIMKLAFDKRNYEDGTKATVVLPNLQNGKKLENVS